MVECLEQTCGMHEHLQQADSFSVSSWMNGNIHTQEHRFLQGSSPPLAFWFSTWLHLQTLPITGARGCISSLIKPGFGDPPPLPPSMAACSWIQIFCRWPHLTQIFWDSVRVAFWELWGLLLPLCQPCPPSLVSPPEQKLCVVVIINWILNQLESWSFHKDRPDLSPLLSHSTSES